jgi:hypothetical protein
MTIARRACRIGWKSVAIRLDARGTGRLYVVDSIYTKLLLSVGEVATVKASEDGI